IYVILDKWGRATGNARSSGYDGLWILVPPPAQTVVSLNPSDIELFGGFPFYVDFELRSRKTAWIGPSHELDYATGGPVLTETQFLLMWGNHWGGGDRFDESSPDLVIMLVYPRFGSDYQYLDEQWRDQKITRVKISNPPVWGTESLSGPTQGTVGTQYSYTVRTTDPDGHRVTYGFEDNLYYDGTLTGNYPEANAGATATLNVVWNRAGTYRTRLWAVDQFGATSWSPQITITIGGVAGYVVNLESMQDNGASSNKGTITLAGGLWAIPTYVTTPGGVSASYSPASGYFLDRWETAGGVSVVNPFSPSPSLTVTGPGTLRAIYSANTFTILLDSMQDNVASAYKGTITLAGVVSSLRTDVTKSAGVYSISYSPASGYTFVRWETVGGVSVSSSTSISTTLNITGHGILKAIYRAVGFVINLESAQDTGASTNKGTITLAGVVSSLPGDVTKPAGVYSVSYSPASGYAFVRWETLGSVSVSSSTSMSTTLTVTGAGKLKAIYSATPQTLYRIDLKSGEDAGTTSNTGQMKFAAVAYSQLPAQVSKAAGSYSISYSPAAGYLFVRWQASGAVVVTQLNSQSTTATVTGQGTLIAVYRKGTVARQPLPFGVALSLEPGKQSVQAGQSASFKVNVRLVYGSAPVVSLDVTDRPGNANYSFSMPSGTPPYSSDLTISTDPSTPPGTYMCTVTCLALDELDSTFVTLIVEGFKSPSLLSITTRQNTVEEGESVTVTGSLAPYLPATIQLIYRNPAGTEIIRQVSTDTGNFTDTFKPDTSGDWSVKAKWVGDSGFEGSESSLARFSVKASPLKIVLPVAAVVVVSVAAALFFYLRKKRSH
ncbi:hypothetical protein MUP05_08150, partial [Candidatus Bathyarchaeota archaeon]|nr:hypothetical protein [Candidatus Bathyarchaeota archaeon]